MLGLPKIRREINKTVNKLGGIITTRLDEPNTERPQLSHMWEVEVQDRQGSGQSIGFYAKTTALPPRAVEPVKHFICGSEYSYAGRDVSPRILRVTFFDNEDHKVYNFMRYWMMLTNEGAAKRKVMPKHYYRDVKIKLNNHRDEVTVSHTFKDCFPTEIGEVSLSYSESTEMTFDVMMSYHDDEVGGAESRLRSIFPGIFSGMRL